VRPFRSRTRNKPKNRNPNYWNMTMAHGWTTERRQQQAAAIKRWQPWKLSTGPRTDGGKAAASRNGWKGGTRPMLRGVAKALHGQRKSLDEVSINPRKSLA